MKYRAPGTDEWAHARLASESGDHVPGGNSVIDATADGMGVFLYSSVEHDGAVHYASTRLLWPYGESGHAFADGDVVELSVHAIAMVYVPEGAFEVGSGGTASGSLTDGAWTEQGGTGGTIPFRITGDPIAMGPSANKLWGTKGEAGGRGGHAGVGAAGALPAAFPTGYEAFYGMKHPITQGQYAEFLNLFTPEQVAERFPNRWRHRRYTIRRDGESFVAQAPDRACNYLSWTDGVCFAAWSGLRPMTELEFEKACRGAAPPVAGEYAWGTTRITPQRGYDGDDGSGTELATLDRRGKTLGGNCNVDSGIRGPVRVGIYADTAGARRHDARECGRFLLGNPAIKRKPVGTDGGNPRQGAEFRGHAR